MSNKNIKIAIVVSIFNQTITDRLLTGAVKTLLGHGIPQKNITTIKVPGAVEIPLTAKMLAARRQYDAIISLGAVIRGDTDHYDYVCQQVSYGCQQVMLEFDIPVIFGVLTTHTVKQARERVSARKGHKGVEAADAAIHMIQLMKSFQKSVN